MRPQSQIGYLARFERRLIAARERQNVAARKRQSVAARERQSVAARKRQSVAARERQKGAARERQDEMTLCHSRLPEKSESGKEFFCCSGTKCPKYQYQSGLHGPGVLVTSPDKHTETGRGRVKKGEPEQKGAER